jgi:hypothetical protein
VPVEIAPGAVVVLGGPRSACRARICASRSGTPASRALVMTACLSELGLMCRGIPAAFAIPGSARADPAPGCGTRHGGPWAAARTPPDRPGPGRRCGRSGRTRAPMHHRHHRGVHQPSLAQAPDVQLRVSPLHPDQRIQPTHFTPGEPLPQLELVQVVRPYHLMRRKGHTGDLLVCKPHDSHNPHTDRGGGTRQPAASGCHPSNLSRS